jgi:hypothetical protein
MKDQQTNNKNSSQVLHIINILAKKQQWTLSIHKKGYFCGRLTSAHHGTAATK